MSFYVYENWTHDRARVHRGACSHCNNGRGKNAGAGGKNGRWLPPFDDRDAALAAARALNRRSTGSCAFCMN